METPSRHSFDLDGSTRVFPIPSPIKGDNYCRLEVDGVVVNDRTLYDIVNNSIVFLDASTVPANSQLDVLVVQSEEAIGQLSITFNIDIVASNIADVNTVATNVANMSTVATDIDNVNSVATNLAGVLDSEANAAEAAADRLQTGLDVLTTNANAAISTTKASEASASATAASTSEANAAASAFTIDTNNILHTQGSGLPNEAYDKAQADAQFAPLISPSLTGTPTAPTATAGDNSAQLATTGFVQSESLSKREITYISPSQHNNLMLIMDGELYTASGDSGYNDNSGTGRGLDAQVATCGLDNIKKVNFPNNTNGGNLIKVGGNGQLSMFALFDNGYLYTWGRNTKGDCGLGHNSPVATPTLSLTDCIEVYSDLITDNYNVTEGSLFVKRSDGYVYASGKNDDGQMGLGTTTHYNTFQKLTWLGTNPKFVGYNNGWGSSVIYQKSDGTIWAAGHGEGGAMFTGVNHTVQSTPIEITNNVGGINGGDVVFSMKTYRYYTTATAGSSHGLLMRRTDAGVTSVWTAGYNEWGMRGDGTTTSSVTPYQVPGMSDVADIVSIGGNPATILALKTNGYLYSWGHNGQGQAGVANTSNVLSPTLVTRDVDKLLTRNVTSHNYDYQVQVFVRKGTDIYCWGYDDGTGYLGVGQSASIRNPVVHPFLTNADDPVKMIGTFTTSLAGHTLVAITESNKLLGWGYNGHHGVLSYNTTNVKYPTQFDLPQENV